jgi:hypothetical protein
MNFKIMMVIYLILHYFYLLFITNLPLNIYEKELKNNLPVTYKLCYLSFYYKNAQNKIDNKLYFYFINIINIDNIMKYLFL